MLVSMLIESLSIICTIDCFISLDQDKIILAVVAWLSVSQIIEQHTHLKNKSSCDAHYVFQAILCIPASFGISLIISEGKFLIFNHVI